MYKNSLIEFNYLDWLNAFQGFLLKFILNQLKDIERGIFGYIAEEIQDRKDSILFTLTFSN